MRKPSTVFTVYNADTVNKVYEQIQQKISPEEFYIYKYTMENLKDFIILNENLATNKQIALYIKGMMKAYKYSSNTLAYCFLSYLSNVDYRFKKYEYRTMLYNQIKKYNSDLICILIKISEDYFIPNDCNRIRELLPVFENDILNLCNSKKHANLREDFTKKNKDLIELYFNTVDSMYWGIQQEMYAQTFNLYEYTIECLSDFILYRDKKPTNKQIVMFMRGMTEAYKFDIKNTEVNIISLMLKLCEVDYKLDSFTYKVRLYRQIKEYNKSLIYILFKHLQYHPNKLHNIILEIRDDLIAD